MDGGDLLFIDKDNLTHRMLSSLPQSSAYFQSSQGPNGIIFASHSGPYNRNQWLGFISSDIQVDNINLHQQSEEYFADSGIILQKCDTSCSKPYNNLLSGQGSWIVSCPVREGSNIFIKKHQLCNETNRFKMEWQYGVSVPRGMSLEVICEGTRVRANSKYVFVLTPKEVIILCSEQGVQVKKIKLWNKQRRGRWSESSVVTSEKYILASRLLMDDEEGHPGRELWR